MGDLEDFRVSFNYAMDRNETLVFSCSCIVQYSGRAESFLPEGDRLIIIKSDKALLIHQPKGNSPVNYMKPETTHDLIPAGSKLIMKSRNLSVREYMDITINRLYFFDSRPLKDSQSLQISGTEKDMADMILKKPEIISPFFKPISREESTKYGFVDILGYENDTLIVVECKRYCGDPKAVDQLRRYVRVIKKSKGIENVQGVLACPSVSPKANKMLADYGYGFVEVRPPKYLERYDRSQKKLDGF